MCLRSRESQVSPLFLFRTELKEDKPAGVTALTVYLGLGWPLAWPIEVQDSLKN